MNFEYFYKEQSNQYAFYRIPKILIVEDYFKDLTSNAKLLYGLLLDRVSLSANSGWIDEAGRVYIIYTIRSIMRDMHCADKKAVRMLRELEKFGLIEKKQQGQGKPMLIYVKNFYEPSLKGLFKNSYNDDSRMVKTTILGSLKEQSNNTNINNNEVNNTNPILSELDVDIDQDERDNYYRYFFDQLEIDCMMKRYPYDKEIVESILDLVCDVVCSKRKVIRIARDDKPVGVVRAQFMKLHSGHVEYVMDCLKNSSSKVRNIKQYLLATLYNAPITMESYYRALVKNDIATGEFYGGRDEENEY